MGVKCIGFGAISNPATGTIDGWTHDPEFYIEAGKKSLAGLKKLIWKVIEAYPFNHERKLELNLFPKTKPLKLKTINTLSIDELSQSIVNEIRKFSNDINF